ncbi:hypothetical protein AMTR_s00114p00075760 [Amborella trichopoda]|uniref:Non-haem dioxygenase N-terminal domain-containing protein n=1 Tax=Amborella trichopoda TaxID=13333 RepID=W1NTQ8_AMBTC|nr:hypothetical protein AMTR_s00114p00075760 [Amborella trichopoda]
MLSLPSRKAYRAGPLILKNMDATVTLSNLSLPFKKDEAFAEQQQCLFDSKPEGCIANQFVWPQEERPSPPHELQQPLIDFHGFLDGDTTATQVAAELVREACTDHGFFQVINHGIHPELIDAAHYHTETFFARSSADKLQFRRARGETSGYTNGHAQLFSSKLPWKETLSFEYIGFHPDNVVHYFSDKMGPKSQQTG